MGKSNSDDHYIYYIYYCGQESLRRNGVVIIVNKTVQNAVLGYNLRMISVSFQDKPFQYSCLENSMNSIKRQKDKTLKIELHRLVGAQYATGKNEEMEPK